jgi:hypothetical protein
MAIYRRVAVTSPFFSIALSQNAPCGVSTRQKNHHPGSVNAGIHRRHTANSPRMFALTNLSQSDSRNSARSTSSLDSPGSDSPGLALRGRVQVRTVLASDVVVVPLNVEALLATPLTWTSMETGADEMSMGLSEAIQNICSANKTKQVAGIRNLRGRDTIYHATQGYILVPHLQAMQGALLKVKDLLASCDAVFGIDRGGGMIVSYLKALEEAGSAQHLERIAKTPARQEIKNSIKPVLDSFLLGKNGPIKVGFVETCISGSSVNTLTRVLGQLKKEYKEYKEYADVEFQIVALRQTQGVVKTTALEKKPGILLSEVSVPYLLAEDVGYQLAEKPETGCKPVILLHVNADWTPTSAYSLTPKNDLVARDLVVALVCKNPALNQQMQSHRLPL